MDNKRNVAASAGGFMLLTKNAPPDTGGAFTQNVLLFVFSFS